MVHIGACNSPFTEDSFSDGSILYKKINDVCKSQIGIDLDAESAAFLNKQKLERSRVVIGNMNDELNLDIKPDVVIFGETLEHLVNLGVALENIKRLLEKDTTLFISVPNALYIRNFVYALFRKEWQHPDHKVAFTTKTLSALLVETGFKEIKVHYGYSMDKSAMNLKGKISLAFAIPVSFLFPMLSANLMITCKKL